MPSFHNNRWTYLTEVLLANGWTEAAAGTVADLAIYDEGRYAAEKTSKHRGRMEFFSRVVTDPMANKRSAAFGLDAAGCIGSIAPPSYTDLAAWEAAVVAQPGELWFFKKMNCANSKGITVVADQDAGHQALALASVADAATRKALESTIDVDFIERLRSCLTAEGAPCPSVAELGRALSRTVAGAGGGGTPQARDAYRAKLESAMKGFVVQRGIQRPLLVSGGRKFCLRNYVVAFTRPIGAIPTPRRGVASSKVASSKEGEESARASDSTERLLEVFATSFQVGRPQKSAWSASSSDGASQFVDGTPDKYVDVSDGSQYDAARWTDAQFPQIKEAVARIARSFQWFEGQRAEPSCAASILGGGGASKAGEGPAAAKAPNNIVGAPAYQAHFSRQIAGKCNPMPLSIAASEGRIAILGLDFMIDEDDKPWLLEINAICNLKHSAVSAIDCRNKKRLAVTIFDLVFAPLVDPTLTPKVAPELFRVY
jgi:hypothetical protein